MPNELKRVRYSLLKYIPFTNCYNNDISIASKFSLEELKAILLENSEYPTKQTHVSFCFLGYFKNARFLTKTLNGKGSRFRTQD